MHEPSVTQSREPLSASKLHAELVDVSAAPVSELRVLAETGSTNAELMEWAAAGAPDYAVVTASHQTAGQGRLGRSFEGAPGSVLPVSMVFSTEGVSPEQWSLISLLAGLAVADTLRETCGLAPELKWPNDVLVDGRKICGILTQAANTKQGTALVVGIGINVAMTEAELPVPHATSVLLAGGTTLDRNDIAVALIRALRNRQNLWRDGNVSELLAEYREKCTTLGAEVRAELPGDKVIVGKAEDINDGGSLIVRDAAGGKHVVTAGDVQHLRRSDGSYAEPAGKDPQNQPRGKDLPPEGLA